MTARRGEAQAFIARAKAYDGTDCLLWPFAKLATSGYPMSKWGTVHVLVCEHEHGPRPAGCDAAHSCGHKLCCTKAHLRWASRSQNEMDKLLHDRSNRGERHGNSKLGRDDVLAIRGARGTQREIAESFGISTGYVSEIKSHKAWSWL